MAIDLEPAKPWERQDNESEEAFEGFDTYAKLGHERSLAKVMQALGKSDTMIERWSRRDQWVRRALAWDRYQSRLSNEKLALGQAGMRVRVVSAAQNMQARAAQAIFNMTDAQIAALKPAEAVAMFRAAVEAERKAREIPDDQFLIEREDAPKFVISFIPSKPEGMVSVRLANGVAGYIPFQRVDEFLAENEGAVAIR